MKLICPAQVVNTTLQHLRDAGGRHQECVVLWLGKRSGDEVTITASYRPLQTAKADMFHIGRQGMAALHDELRRLRLMVAAQVHSHPFEAFHSKADDAWAIVRHEGALSLVVPHFASQTQAANFLQMTKVYRFSAAAHWAEVPQADVTRKCLQIS
jgi:hypothetical protein